MTQLGFVLDQRACIGCHACTVACKVEHGVELGVFRTWVKYIEHGTLPDARRSFSVLRCNQCTDAPCVKACPTTALFRREDGIVDFDPEHCIGCKVCMNACPYDALYIDPNDGTAGKCNFCAHRVDAGMQPACEVVCPTDAIISGDLDDPTSRVSRLLEEVPFEVRAPEQRTGPNVFYLGAAEAAIDPLQVAGGEAYLYSEVADSQREKLAPLAEEASAVAMHDVAHPPPWGWRVSSYFLTKGIAAGAMMLAAGGMLAGLVALAGIAATGAFLIWDLKRPERFYYLFVRPQRRSWLALGTWCINAAATVALAYTVLGGDVLRWLMVPAGALLAGYTAFLFGQCEGRDLWQSRWLLPHTIVNALLAGAAALALLGEGGLEWWISGAAAASVAIVGADTFGRHATQQAAQAARNLWHGRRYWAGVALIAAAVVLAPVLAPAAAIAALVGLWLYEDAWVRAYRPGEKITLAEYYRWMFEHSVPGLPEKAAEEGLDPLAYMRRYGAVDVPGEVYAQHECEVAAEGAEVRGDEETVTRVAFDGAHLPLTGRPDTVAAMVDGAPRRGFNTPSRKLELYSETLAEWGWPEHATPRYFRSHVHRSLIDHAAGEYVLLPTYRLPTMIHSRSGNAKYLTELSHTHPLLVCPEDAERIGSPRTTSFGSRRRSAGSRSRRSSPRASARAWWPPRITWGAGGCERLTGASAGRPRWSTWRRRARP